MRPITMMQAQWKATTAQGPVLRFKNCKGGHFSADDRYGLKVLGKMAQSTSSPSPESPQPIRCVRAGTIIQCSTDNDGANASAITVPCDLYEGDVWYPMSGHVERRHALIDLSDIPAEKWSRFAGTNINQFYASGVLVGMNTDISKELVYSDCYKSISIRDRYGNYNTIYAGSQETLCINAMPELTSISQFLAHIAETHPTVIYKLADPSPNRETFAPQTMYAPAGTVIVATAQAIGIPAEFSATMLTRR